MRPSETACIGLFQSPVVLMLGSTYPSIAISVITRRPPFMSHQAIVLAGAGLAAVGRETPRVGEMDAAELVDIVSDMIAFHR